MLGEAGGQKRKYLPLSLQPAQINTLGGRCRNNIGLGSAHPGPPRWVSPRGSAAAALRSHPRPASLRPRRGAGGSGTPGAPVTAMSPLPGTGGYRPPDPAVLSANGRFPPQEWARGPSGPSRTAPRRLSSERAPDGGAARLVPPPRAGPDLRLSAPLRCAAQRGTGKCYPELPEAATRRLPQKRTPVLGLFHAPAAPEPCCFEFLIGFPCFFSFLVTQSPVLPSETVLARTHGC